MNADEDYDRGEELIQQHRANPTLKLAQFAFTQMGTPVRAATDEPSAVSNTSIATSASR